MYGPTPAITSVTTGSTACWSTSATRAGPGSGGGALSIPPDGNQPRVNAKTRIIKMPTHQAGIAYETAARYDTARSVRLPARVAIRTPTLIPAAAVMTSAVVSNAM